MSYLTDEIIENTIDNISGYIVSIVAEKTKEPLEVVLEKFIKSRTYELLTNKETGYYFDSIPELIGMFEKECASRFRANG